MGRYCSDCENLNTKDSKGDGVYKCKKSKKYVYAHTEACEKFDKNYGRNSREKERLYDLGKEAERNKPSEPIPYFLYFLIFLILILAAIFI